jgi:SAM-dependent methyltransferase
VPDPPADRLPPDWDTWRRQVDLARYDERWQQLAAAGENPHGEADLVERFGPRTVLDGGCGTGRVAIELARRGIEVLGVDLDPDMLEHARTKAPELAWVCSSLADLDLGRSVDLVVLAGNVIPFAAPDVRAAVVEACARHLVPGGHLVAGFSLRPGWPSLTDYDGWAAAAGLVATARFATWDGDEHLGGDYAVSVHRRPEADFGAAGRAR